MCSLTPISHLCFQLLCYVFFLFSFTCSQRKPRAPGSYIRSFLRAFLRNLRPQLESMAFHAGKPLYVLTILKDLLVIGELTMPPQIPISSLLDSDCSAEALRDIQPHLTLVVGLLSRSTPLSAPSEIKDCLSRVIEYFGLPNIEPSQHLPVLLSHEDSLPRSTNNDMRSWAGSFTRNAVPFSVLHNVKLNRQTTLTMLYIYDDINAYLEYPETSATQPVGYLFCHDPRNWENPTRCFAYSLGKLSGQTRKGEEVLCAPLTMEDGRKVPCIESHYTCMLPEDLSMQYISNILRPRCKSLPHV